MDFIDLFAEIFKLDYSIINEYASQGPIYQLFYIVFFPTVFIIFFIYILSRLVIYSHKGIRIMISVAIYAFIVLQGYYRWFVYFSRFWLFGLLLIGILYMIITRGHEPKPQGGVKAKSISSVKTQLGNIFIKKTTGRLDAEVKTLEEALMTISSVIESFEKGNSKDIDNIYGGPGGLFNQLQTIRNEILKIWDETSIASIPITGDVKKLIKLYNEVARKVRTILGVKAQEIKG